MTYLTTIFVYWFRRYQAWLRVGRRNIILTLFLIISMTLMSAEIPRLLDGTERDILNYLNAAVLLLMFPFLMIGLHECRRSMRLWSEKSERAGKAHQQMKDWK